MLVIQSSWYFFDVWADTRCKFLLHNNFIIYIKQVKSSWYTTLLTTVVEMFFFVYEEEKDERNKKCFVSYKCQNILRTFTLKYKEFYKAQ